MDFKKYLGKVTSRGRACPNENHMRKMIWTLAGYNEKVSPHEAFVLLYNRTFKDHWTIALKTLYLIHRCIDSIDEDLNAKLSNIRSTNVKLNSGRSTVHEPLIREYLVYIRMSSSNYARRDAFIRAKDRDDVINRYSVIELLSEVNILTLQLVELENLARICVDAINISQQSLAKLVFSFILSLIHI